MANARRRLVPLKFLVLGVALCSLGVISYVNKDNEQSYRRTLQQDELSHDCDCPDCFEPKDFPFTCCIGSGDTSMCLTKDGDMCPERYLCDSHLVPGSSGGGECLADWEMEGGVVVYIVVLLYLFLGLAIVCDDYFVPSLEKISQGLSLSEDVAGATFMAAGSSAPELFVSLADNVVANPPKSLGIGTIIGSAIFNILVIIGLSALLAGKSLALDWHPLARDSLFYTISIVALILVVYDGEARWYEGLILMCLYGCYVGFMTVNVRVFDWVDSKLGYTTESSGADGVHELPTKNIDGSGSNVPSGSESTLHSIEEGGVELAIEDKSTQQEGKNDEADSEMKQVLPHTVETSRPAAAVAAAASAGLRRAGSDPHLVCPDSPAVRRKSNQNPLHMSKYRSDWKSFARESLNNDKKTFREVAETVMRVNAASKKWRKQVEDSKAAAALEGNTEQNEVSRTDGEADEGDEEGYFECLMWPLHPANKEGSNSNCLIRACCSWTTLWQARLWYIMTLPLNLVFRLTIPDCNHDNFCEDKEGKEENRKVGYSLTFVMCIIWIAVLSHFLVFCAAKFGCIVGLSPPVMGLTILAAGTSVPDALSSVIVARMGQGDMAVANSIGSNVFDILIGLGIPWFIAELVYDTPSTVKTDSLWIGIAFLFGVLVFLLGIIILNKWILSRRVGVFLILLYVAYVLFELFLHPLVK